MITGLINAQHGILKESISMQSKILGKDVRYSIYLPAGYEESNRRYPVLYLLHGYTDNETAWVQFGEVNSIFEKQLQQGETVPMIIVMPDAGVSWYVNSYDGKTKYEDFFVNELIPFIDATYKTRPVKEFRAIAGLSMGGYGTLIMSMKHPELFSAAAPLSAGIRTIEEIIQLPDTEWDTHYETPFGSGRKGEDRLTKHFVNYQIHDMISNGDLEKIRTVRYYIDCGDDDFLIKGNMKLHTIMIDNKIPHEFRVRDGSHNWEYWRTALPEVFRFISAGFHR